MHRDEVRHEVREGISQLRTHETYNADVNEQNVSTTGIKEECIFHSECEVGNKPPIIEKNMLKIINCRCLRPSVFGLHVTLASCLEIQWVMKIGTSGSCTKPYDN